MYSSSGARGCRRGRKQREKEKGRTYLGPEELVDILKHAQEQLTAFLPLLLRLFLDLEPFLLRLGEERFHLAQSVAEGMRIALVSLGHLYHVVSRYAVSW